MVSPNPRHPNQTVLGTCSAACSEDHFVQIRSQSPLKNGYRDTSNETRHLKNAFYTIYRRQMKHRRTRGSGGLLFLIQYPAKIELTKTHVFSLLKVRIAGRDAGEEKRRLSGGKLKAYLSNKERQERDERRSRLNSWKAEL
jgi:hypothetical protein